MPKIGDRIRVNANHWCRHSDVGVVVETTEASLASPGPGRFLIRFERAGVGIQTRYLFLGEKDFEIIGNEPRKRTRKGKIPS